MTPLQAAFGEMLAELDALGGDGGGAEAVAAEVVRQAGQLQQLQEELRATKQRQARGLVLGFGI